MRRIVFLIALIFSLSAATMVCADAPAKEPVEELKQNNISAFTVTRFTPSTKVRHIPSAIWKAWPPTAMRVPNS